MKTVVLKHPEESNMSSFFKDYLKDNTAYAIRLVGEPFLSRSVVCPVNTERLQRLKEKKHDSVWDREPNTLYEYSQPCIEYYTKADFEKGVGVYQEYLDETVIEHFYEFEATFE